MFYRKGSPVSSSVAGDPNIGAQVITNTIFGGFLILVIVEYAPKPSMICSIDEIIAKLC